MLKDIRALCKTTTIVHINVPNAHSFHRILAKAMGVISEVDELSLRNIALQQNRVYDLTGLMRAVAQGGFEVLSSGSYFIKPFTHDQMQKMMREGIIDRSVLEGLYLLGEEVEGLLGSEIYVICRIK